MPTFDLSPWFTGSQSDALALSRVESSDHTISGQDSDVFSEPFATPENVSWITAEPLWRRAFDVGTGGVGHL